MEYVSVLILNKSIEERGLLTNAAFVLGLSAGKLLPTETFGTDVTDGDGREHQSLTNIAHHVRKARPAKLATLRNTFAEMSGVNVVDYTEDAAPSDYATYTKELGKHQGDEIIYRAVHIYGPADKIVPLTKNLSRA